MIEKSFPSTKLFLLWFMTKQSDAVRRDSRSRNTQTQISNY